MLQGFLSCEFMVVIDKHMPSHTNTQTHTHLYTYDVCEILLCVMFNKQRPNYCHQYRKFFYH